MIQEGKEEYVSPDEFERFLKEQIIDVMQKVRIGRKRHLFFSVAMWNNHRADGKIKVMTDKTL